MQRKTPNILTQRTRRTFPGKPGKQDEAINSRLSWVALTSIPKTGLCRLSGSHPEHLRSHEHPRYVIQMREWWEQTRACVEKASRETKTKDIKQKIGRQNNQKMTPGSHLWSSSDYADAYERIRTNSLNANSVTAQKLTKTRHGEVKTKTKFTPNDAVEERAEKLNSLSSSSSRSSMVRACNPDAKGSPISC